MVYKFIDSHEDKLKVVYCCFFLVNGSVCFPSAVSIMTDIMIGTNQVIILKYNRCFTNQHQP